MKQDGEIMTEIVCTTTLNLVWLIGDSSLSVERILCHVNYRNMISQ